MRRIHVSVLAVTLLIPLLIAAQEPAAPAPARSQGKGAQSPQAQEAAARYAAADIRVLVPGIILEGGVQDLAAAYTKETGKKVAVSSAIMGALPNLIKTANPPADVIMLPFELMTTLSLEN